MTTPEFGHRFQEDLDSDLLKCVLEANKELLQELLDAGANALKIDGEKGSPLSCAITSGDEEMVRMLLTTVSDMAQPCTAEGMPPLHHAVRRGNVDVARLLLDQGAEVNSRDGIYRTALHIAIESNRTDVVELLVEHGADMNNVVFDGKPALHLAQDMGYKGVVEVLLDNGADVYFKAKSNRIPLQWVLVMGNHRCLEPLERHIIKLKAASLYVLGSNLLAISAATKFPTFQGECESEIQRMKQFKIHKNISFYNIIAQDPNRVSVYMKNREVHQAMISGEYKTMFPIYAKMIENRFLKGQRRLELLEASLESLNTLVGHRLPHMFLMDVLVYLNQEDHKNLIASTKEMKSLLYNLQFP